MPRIIRLNAGPVSFEVNYFDELIFDGTVDCVGCLTKDLAAHALWYYYILAMQQYTRAKKNIVYDDELSHKFDVNTARNILQSVSNLYGQSIEDMVKYWPLMEQQRMQLGGGDTLPSQYKFQFTVN